jgi:hypothetical protein
VIVIGAPRKIGLVSKHHMSRMRPLIVRMMTANAALRHKLKVDAVHENGENR